MEKNNVGDSATEIFGPMLLLVLTIVSWYFRPADRKVSAVPKIYNIGNA